MKGAAEEAAPFFMPCPETIARHRSTLNGVNFQT